MADRPCSVCDGSGVQAEQCRACGGTGNWGTVDEAMSMDGYGDYRAVGEVLRCGACGGGGVVPEPCYACDGSGRSPNGGSRPGSGTGENV